MRRRVGAGLALYYGDAGLAAPVYDYDRLFTASDKALVAELGPETLNPGYRGASGGAAAVYGAASGGAVDCADRGDLRAGGGGAKSGAECGAVSAS